VHVYPLLAAMGLSVTGKAANAGAVMRKGGVRPGQVLVLTKGVGTGTVMAAHMKLKAKGEWVKAALDSMVMSNKPAAQILKAHGATSCTDVTGFGLLGHLVEMVQASDKELQSNGSINGSIGLEAVLKLDDVPVLAGAAECVAAGVFSSLQPQNLRLKRAVANEEEATKRVKFPLLFDPQTAGGLLASIPEANVAQCMDELKLAGCTSAAVIGFVREIASEKAGGPQVIVIE
jgi:selenide,water dikinase